MLVHSSSAQLSSSIFPLAALFPIALHSPLHAQEGRQYTGELDDFFPYFLLSSSC